MPQLDFFSFSNQFFYTILFFCGLYYSNLLILFPRLKWLYLHKQFLPKFVLIEDLEDLEDNILDASGTLEVVMSYFNF